MSAGPRILFVPHSASRTGAPLMLLSFLRWLRSERTVGMQVLVVQDGELSSDFAQIAPVLTLIGEGGTTGVRLLRRVSWTSAGLGPPPAEASRIERAIRLPARRAVLRSMRRRLDAAGPYDLIYLNSAHAAQAVELLPASVPVLTHVHELSYQLDQLPSDQLTALHQRTNRYVAAAGCVRDTLIEKLDVPADQIDVCHEFIPIPRTPPDPAHVRAVREELGLRQDTLVVGAVGAIGWIKGPDLLIHVAKRVLDTLRSERDVAFVWMGSAPLSWTLGELAHDIQAAGLKDRVKFIAARSDPRPTMAAFDVFALPSRSDVFPLVCLEAASLGKPIVCFDAGGMREFLKPEERLVVPYLDLDAMAGRIVELLRSEDERRAIGARLSERVRARHSLEVGAPILMSYVESMLGSAHRAARTENR